MVVMVEGLMRTEEQRRAALDVANGRRIARKEIKESIFRVSMADGLAEVQRLLEERPEDIATMRVFDLLRAVRGYSQVKAMSVLHQVPMSQAKTVAGMTDRQVNVLLGTLGELEKRARDYARLRAAKEMAERQAVRRAA